MEHQEPTAKNENASEINAVGSTKEHPIEAHRDTPYGGQRDQTPQKQKVIATARAIVQIVSENDKTIVVVISLIGLLFAGLTLIYMDRQTDIAATQTALATMVFQYDQRPWIAVVTGEVQITDGNMMDVPVRVTNTGKTPAEHLEGHIVTTVLQKGDEIDTSYEPGHLRNPVFGGTLMPNDSGGYLTKIGALQLFKGETGNILVNAELRQAINEGRLYVVTYGRLAYSDVLGGEHWITFCSAGSGVPVSGVNGCAEYNAVDHNEPHQ